MTLLGKTALQQLEQRADLAGAPLFDRAPLLARQRLDRDLDGVEFGAADLGLDPALVDGQVADGAVADVGAAARQAVLKVAERFQVLAPGFAPEGLGDLAAFDRDRLDVHALLAQGVHLLHRLAGAVRPPKHTVSIR